MPQKEHRSTSGAGKVATTVKATNIGAEIDAAIRRVLTRESQMGGILQRHGLAHPSPSLVAQIGAAVATGISGDKAPAVRHLRDRVALLEGAERTAWDEQRKAERRLRDERRLHRATKEKLAATVLHEKALEDRVAELGRVVKKERDRADELKGEEAQALQCRDDAESKMRQMEQEMASLRRQLHTAEADLATVRAGRDRERREYLESRGVHDQEVLAANDRAATAEKAAEGFHQACEAEHREFLRVQGELAEAVARADRFDQAVIAANARAREYQQDTIKFMELYGAAADALSPVQASLRTADAHSEQLSRELRQANSDLAFYTAHAALWERAHDKVHAALGGWVEVFAVVIDAAHTRENTIHRQLTESIETYANFPEIARTLRAVRVMLFPPAGHHEVIALINPQG